MQPLLYAIIVHFKVGYIKVGYFIMQNNINWSDYHYFIKAVKLGAAKAAMELGVNISTIYRKISSLEEKLGEKLIVKHSRGYKLTKHGEQIFNMIAHVDDTLSNVPKIITDDIKNISGNISLTLDSFISNYYIVKPLADIIQNYPNIKVDILSESKDILSDYADIKIFLSSPNVPMPANHKFTFLTTIPWSLCINRELIGDMDIEIPLTKNNTAEFIDFVKRKKPYLFLPQQSLRYNYQIIWTKKFFSDDIKIMQFDKCITSAMYAQQNIGIALLPSNLVSMFNLEEVIRLPDVLCSNLLLTTATNVLEYDIANIFINYLKEYFQ